MEIKVNETPVRTSRNFRINNVKLEDVNIPENLKEFKNVNIDYSSSTFSKNPGNKKLVFGNGEVLEENCNNNSNSNIKLELNKETVKIIYEFDDENLNLVNNIELVANKNSNVIIEYKSNTNKPCFHNGIIRTIVKENVKLNISIINFLNNQSLNFESMETEISDKANVQYTIIDLGGKNSITNYYSNLIGVESVNDLKSIYLGQNEELKDVNYIAHLNGQKSKVNIDVQGAIDNNAIKNFKGTIDFKKGCKKAKGSENEFCLMLSPKAKSRALPMLLCTEDNVEGEHSTASGSVENSELFYIMSRGLSYKEAIKLIVKSRFNSIIERIPDDDIKQEVINQVDIRL